MDLETQYYNSLLIAGICRAQDKMNSSEGTVTVSKDLLCYRAIVDGEKR